MQPWVSGDTDLENAASVVGQYQEDVQDLEANRRYGEEINRDHRFDVIVQERSPRLRRRSVVVPHVLPDAGLTDVDAEFEEFTMDAWCAPQWILPTHPTDELPNVVWNRRPSGPPAADLPGPEQPEACAMPRDDGVRFDDDEG